METETETEQSAGRLTISLPQKKQSQFSSVEWRTKQLLAMAEVFREPLTAELLAMYVESLADLSDEQIRLCAGRAIRGLKWFPKPAELRELVGCNPKQEQPEAPAFKPTPMPEPLTDAQLRDRREMLRQQIAALSKATDAKGEQQ